MPEIGTSGSMSGGGNGATASRTEAAAAKAPAIATGSLPPPRSSSTLLRDAGERSHLPQGWCVTYQMAEVAVPRNLFREILRRVDELRRRPAPA